jgi:hypothetical protein
LTIGRPDERRAATTSTSAPPARNFEPTFHQRSSALGCSMKNAPSIP